MSTLLKLKYLDLLKKSSNPYNYMPYKNFREMRTNLSELQNYLVMLKAYYINLCKRCVISIFENVDLIFSRHDASIDVQRDFAYQN